MKIRLFFVLQKDWILAFWNGGSSVDTFKGKLADQQYDQKKRYQTNVSMGHARVVEWSWPRVAFRMADLGFGVAD